MAHMSRILHRLRAILLILQIQQTMGGGRLYFGFTQYDNVDNRRSDGACCDGVEDQTGRCPMSCDLIFDLSISELDGPNNMHRRPSDTPFSSSGQSRLPFQSQNQNMMNPLTFTFDTWPACLNAVVEICDVDLPISGNGTGTQVLQLVDTMALQVALARPSSFFTLRRLVGQRQVMPSNLTVVIRYDCDTQSPDKPCPPDPIRNMTSLPENIMDCPPSTTTPSTTTTSTTTTTTTPTPPSSPTTPKSTSRTSESTTTTETTSTTTRRTPSPPTPSTTPTPRTSPRTSTSAAPEKSTSSTPSSLITKEENDDGPMAYWAVILGAVLGFLVVIGVIGFIVYSRRRKSMYKRQEIYTVTPRVVSIVEENGTAGRSDIPMETMQY